MSSDKCYINFDHVQFYYTKKNIVLNGVTMHINKGEIFALLGANGNGKTTLIKLLVGVLKPKSGSITIQGKKPGSKGLDVPGRLVGYMPQETALYTELTIEQLFYYYGYVFGMNDKLIEQRIRYLYENIDLKERDKTIGSLSGGQQRSVSMAVTLIHSPELVIWDEPTVGLDPIKREKMWRFLYGLCREQGLTVLITTHYIEEAKQANQVAFIYRGICLEQNKPQNLLDKYNCSTLEQVSYLACSNYDKASQQISVMRNEYVGRTFTWKTNNLKMSMSHMMALMWKIFTQFKNNWTPIFIFILLPIQVIALLPYCYGPPRNIPIGISDNDRTNLTTSFVDNLDSRTINVQLFDRIEEGIKSVERGKNFFFAEIRNGFTEKLRKIRLGQIDEDEFEEESDNDTRAIESHESSISALMNRNGGNDSINLYLDITNVVPSYYALVNVLTSFQKAFTTNEDIFGDKRSHSRPSNLFAVQIQEPIYGSFAVEYKDSNVCGQIIMITFSNAVMLSSLMINNEKRSGVKYRDRVAGITKLEVLMTVILSDVFLSVVAIVLHLSSMYFIYDTLVFQRFFESSLLLALVSINATLTGLVIAMIFKDRVLISFFSFSLIIILLITSGTVWPVQSYPEVMQTITSLLPFTHSVSSMQSLLISGLSIHSPQVMFGFCVNIFYVILLLIIIICITIF